MNIRLAQSLTVLWALTGAIPLVATAADAPATADKPVKEKRPAKENQGAPAAKADKPRVKAKADKDKNPAAKPADAKPDEPKPLWGQAPNQAAPAPSPPPSPAKTALAAAVQPKHRAAPVAPDVSKDIDSLRREIADLKAAQEAVLGPPPAKAQPSPPPEVQERLAALTKERKEVETKLARLEAAVSGGLVERETVAASFEALRARLVSVTAEIEQANRTVVPPTPRPTVLQRLDAIEGRVSNLASTAAAPATPPPAAAAPVPATPPPAPAPAQSAATGPSSPAPPPAPAGAPSFKIEAGEGNSLKVGLLLQPQYQVAGDFKRDGYGENLFLRRTRILLGGTLFGRLDYFIDTDYPNLFLTNDVTGTDGAADTAVKNSPGMNIQDAFGTFRIWKDMVKVDAGYMLPALAHNALQGATTLYSWDYLSYSFLHSAAFPATSNPIGRDLGLQVRGLLLGGIVEYRVGMFQGLRKPRTTSDVSAKNFFRLAGRVQANLLDPETGFFYQGTYLGKKKILSVGASFDVQDAYRYFAGDVFADLPVGPVGVATGQVNVAHWNGGSFIAAIPKQTAVMAEAGFYFSALKISPIVKVDVLDGSGTVADEYRISGGIAYWPYSHNCNVKAFFTRSHRDRTAHAANQFNLQWQIYVF